MNSTFSGQNQVSDAPITAAEGAIALAEGAAASTEAAAAAATEAAGYADTEAVLEQEFLHGVSLHGNYFA